MDVLLMHVSIKCVCTSTFTFSFCINWISTYPDLCNSSSLLFVIQSFRKVSWSRWTPYLWRMWERRGPPTRRACAQVKGTCCAGGRSSWFALEICCRACWSCEAANMYKWHERAARDWPTIKRAVVLLHTESSVDLKRSCCVFLVQQSSKAPAHFNTVRCSHKAARYLAYMQAHTLQAFCMCFVLHEVTANA